MRRIQSLFAPVTILVLLSFPPPLVSAEEDRNVQLIPQPVRVERTDGVFVISPLTPVIAMTASAAPPLLFCEMR